MSSLFSSRVVNEEDDKYDLDNLSPPHSPYSSGFRTQTLHSPPGTRQHHLNAYSTSPASQPRFGNAMTEADLELPESDESDAEVPPSLMIEIPRDEDAEDDDETGQRPLLSQRQWEKSPVRERSQPVRENVQNLRKRIPPQSQSTRTHMTTQDRTMWRWANIDNMDNFFQRVYSYYTGKGYYCILLARFLNLL